MLISQGFAEYSRLSFSSTAMWATIWGEGAIGAVTIPIETVQLFSDRHRAYAVSVAGTLLLIEAVHDEVGTPAVVTLEVGLFSKTVYCDGSAPAFST